MFCHACLAPSAIFMTDDELVAANEVVPVTLLLTMMPYPAGTSAPPVLIVRVDPALPDGLRKVYPPVPLAFITIVPTDTLPLEGFVLLPIDTIPAAPVFAGAGPKPKVTDLLPYDVVQIAVVSVPDDEVEKLGLFVLPVVLCQLPPASP